MINALYILRKLQTAKEVNSKLINFTPIEFYYHDFGCVIFSYSLSITSKLDIL